jgi:hypothetical protein
MLSSHDQVASLPASGIIRNLIPHLHRYVGSDYSLDVKSVVADGLRLMKTHPSGRGFPFSLDDVLREMQSGSYWEFMRSVNVLNARASGAMYWLSKEPNIFEYAYHITAHMPEAKFIYLIRDGRDVAASMLKGRLHEQHIYRAACRWKNDQIHCLNLLADPLMNQKTYMIKYEDLICEAETELRRLTSFIGIGYADCMLEFYKNSDIKKQSESSGYWSNLSVDIKKDNQRKYMQCLTKRQINIFQSVAHRELMLLGYDVPNDVKNLSPLSVKLYNLSARIRKKLYMKSGAVEVKIRKDWREAAKAISGHKYSNI